MSERTRQKAEDCLKQTRLYIGGIRVLRREPRLLPPPELVWEVATYFQRSQQLRVLANLSETCRLIRQVCHPILYEEVFWEDAGRRPWVKCEGHNERWKFTKYLVIHEHLFKELQLYGNSTPTELRLDSFNRLFPNLVIIQVMLRYEENDEDATEYTLISSYIFTVLPRHTLCYERVGNNFHVSVVQRNGTTTSTSNENNFWISGILAEISGVRWAGPVAGSITGIR